MGTPSNESAVTRANRRIYKQLTNGFTEAYRHRLHEPLGRKAGSARTLLGRLRQSPPKPNSKHTLEHIDRLQT